MYNGIGLTTPRGSGTNGYVVRNLALLRNHETAEERAKAYDALAPPKHREPDEAILEHEKKRKVEAKCLEFQVKLEEEGVEEEEIEKQVDELRQRLLADLEKLTAVNAKKLKASDTHGIAAAKKVEMERFQAAFGTRRDYNEGDAFNQEKQAELKQRRAETRAEAERQNAEGKRRFEENQAKWAAEKKEKDRLRRREEDKQRQEMLKNRDVDMGGPRRMPPPLSPQRPHGKPTRRDPSRSPPPPPPRRHARSPSPVAGERRRRPSRSPSRSRSPSPRRRYRSPPRRRISPPIARDRDREQSRSPRIPGRGGSFRRSRSPPPPARRLSVHGPAHRHISRSRSPPPRRSSPSAPTPRDSPPPRQRGRQDSRDADRKRSASASSGGSAMSVSSEGSDRS